MRRTVVAAIVAFLVACTAAPPQAAPSPAERSASPTVGQIVTATPAASAGRASGSFVLQEFVVPRGQSPHDVAPAADGGVWYTAQAAGALGWLDPKNGETRAIPLGTGSAPHGVIVGPDGAPWVTDGGLNAIVRVDPATRAVKRYPLPPERPNTNLNTAVFDRDGTLWFTGQNGVFGRLDPKSGATAVFDAPRGAGPYGIAACADGNVYFASLAGSYIGLVQRETGGTVVLSPPTAGQGARRVWCDSESRVWVSEWNSGQLARYDGATWKEWKLPGAKPMAYAVFVDDADVVWITDWGANALVRFDPVTETFTVVTHPQPNANLRHILGRPGELWGAASGQDKLVVARPTPPR
jgi:virginiamycin B lyase